jgi:predicted extracellular nuclease
MTANPAGAPCPSSIPAIRNQAHPAHVPPGTRVSVMGAVVTAVKTLPVGSASKGFWMQDLSASEYAGIFVYTGAVAPAVAVGDLVDVAGKYEEFRGLAELTAPEVSRVGAAAAPPSPLVVNPAEVATAGARAEPLESMLLRVENVTVTAANPDAPMQFDEFELAGGLRVDDFILDGVNDGQPTYAMGTAFTSITGVLYYSFGNHKLTPRTPSDLVAR